MRRSRPRGIRGLALRAAALTAVALAAGCGGSDEPDEPRQVGEQGGLKVYEVRSQGFALGLPRDWRVVSVDEALPEDAREELTRENPEFGEIIEAISSEDQPIKLLAFDPEVRDEFATNVNVIAVELPGGVGLDEFVSANRADIEGFGALVGEVASDPVDLPAGPAERLDYRLRITTQGEQREVATLQYLLTGERTGYVVTFSTLPAHSGRHAATFDRIVRSLRLD